ncbi:MAG: TIGR00366 family protein [Thermaurantimonas sp.]
MSKLRIISAEHLFRNLIPGQFGIAFVITMVVMVAALWRNGLDGHGFFLTLDQWQKGFWDGSLMIFTLQMLLILVFGYSIAISPKVHSVLKSMAELPRSGSQAVVFATLISSMAAWLNWGLGLVAGAIYVRLTGYSLQRRKIPFDYPLLGASGYTGMMIWHGGLSGSAPLKAAESGHLRSMVSSDIEVSDSIAITSTLLSTSTLIITLVACLSVVVTLLLLSSRRKAGTYVPEIPPLEPEATPNALTATGAETLEFKKWPARLVSLLIFGFLVHTAIQDRSLGFFSPNVVISILLASGLWLHASLRAYMLSIDRAITSASGVVLLFPFYFGIIGLLRYSGIITDITGWFVSHAGAASFLQLVFVSSSLLNILIPSGGGQWAIQGPVILEAGAQLGIPLENVIMCFAFGDQLTNMLQPFWAIPLLYITRIRASELLGYTFFIFLTGLLVFGLGILLFY